MSSLPQSPSIQFPIDDHDFDDDALWAVIDSASAASSRSRKPLLAAAKGEPRAFSPDAGEVVQRRPPKTARLTPDNRVLVVKNSTRTPLAASSPAAAVYSVKEVSPVIECPQSPAVMNQWRSEEKENFASHSLLGRFPSVSAFKQYQNAAMAHSPSISSCRQPALSLLHMEKSHPSSLDDKIPSRPSLHLFMDLHHSRTR